MGEFPTLEPSPGPWKPVGAPGIWAPECPRAPMGGNGGHGGPQLGAAPRRRSICARQQPDGAPLGV
eukprot:5786348-Alexandrium_andersonii.AAC.1